MRLRPIYTIALISALLFGAFSARLCAQQPQKLNSFELDHAHVMLHQAYEDVKKNYYDPKFHGVDLDAAFHKYDARLNAAKSINESYRVIAAFLNELHDTHTFLMPPARVNRSASGFHAEMVGDKCFITRVRPGTDAARKVHVGDQLIGLNGFNVRRADFGLMEYFLLILSPARAYKLDLVSPSGQQREEIVDAVIRPGKKVLDFTGGNGGSDIWDTIRSDEDEADRNRERIWESGDVMVWKMPRFYVSQDTVGSIFSKARKHKALVVDLRGNPGGAVDVLKDMLGHVFDHDVKLAERVSRKNEKPEMVKAKGTPYTGKLIVLVDSDSASSAELFARVIQLEHRGIVIGDRSAGAVMEARHYDESLGTDVRIFYGFSITSADLVMADGKSLEHTGVVPDELILPSAADLAAGNDPVLSDAVTLAGAKLDPAAAGKLFPFEWPSL